MVVSDVLAQIIPFTRIKRDRTVRTRDKLARMLLHYMLAERVHLTEGGVAETAVSFSFLVIGHMKNELWPRSAHVITGRAHHGGRFRLAAASVMRMQVHITRERQFTRVAFKLGVRLMVGLVGGHVHRSFHHEPAYSARLLGVSVSVAASYVSAEVDE